MDLKTRFMEITKGDVAAADFLLTVMSIYRVWDNLIDKDKPVTDDHVCRALWTALIDLPRNTFYQQHFQELNSVMGLGIQNWLGSNSLAASDSESDKRISFITRGAEADLTLQVALICGGYEWAKLKSADIRRAWHTQPFSEYLEGFSRGKPL